MLNESSALDRRHLGMVATVTAAGLLALLTVYAALSYWHLRTITANRELAQESSSALSALAKMLSALQDAETGQRGFLLTADPSYLEPYQQSLARVEEARRELQQNLLDEPDQLARVGELDRHLAAKLDELSETIQIYRQQGAEAARRAVLEHRGLREMDEIRSRMAAIEKQETERRDTRRSESDASIRVALGSSLVTATIGCLITVIGFYLVQREMSARQRLAEYLQVADRNKNEFLAMLGHELRNPLAAIHNAVEALGLVASQPEMVDEVRAIIQRQTSVMSRWICDLLDTSRIAHGKIELRRSRLDVVELTKRAITDTQTAMPETDVMVLVNAPSEAIWLNGDAERLAQAIGNLVHNSLKFSPCGSRIEVDLAVLSSPRRVRISVADHGIGMDSATLQRVFEPFAQGRANGDRSRGGLGLGLALAKGLIQLHGGQLAAHSPGPGRGTTFDIVLPLDGRDRPAQRRALQLQFFGS